jgi:hypothetical protein
VQGTGGGVPLAPDGRCRALASSPRAGRGHPWNYRSGRLPSDRASAWGNGNDGRVDDGRRRRSDGRAYDDGRRRRGPPWIRAAALVRTRWWRAAALVTGVGAGAGYMRRRRATAAGACGGWGRKWTEFFDYGWIGLSDPCIRAIDRYRHGKRRKEIIIL